MTVAMRSVRVLAVLISIWVLTIVVLHAHTASDHCWFSGRLLGLVAGWTLPGALLLGIGLVVVDLLNRRTRGLWRLALAFVFMGWTLVAATLAVVLPTQALGDLVVNNYSEVRLTCLPFVSTNYLNLQVRMLWFLFFVNLGFGAFLMSRGRISR